MTPSLPGNDVWRPHVTVATIVHDGERFLMVEERVNGKIAYNQPAGHLDEGECLIAAACRETVEETGWTVEVQHLVAIDQWRSHEHGDQVLRFTFAAKALGHDNQPLDTGIERALWLTRAEIGALGAKLRSPLVASSIDKWLAGSRLPLGVIGNLLPGIRG